MNYRFILFSPWLLKSPVVGGVYSRLALHMPTNPYETLYIL